MKTYNELAAELFERRAEHEKTVAKRKKIAGMIAIPAVAVAVTAAAVFGGMKLRRNAIIEANNSPAPQSETPIVTQAPATELPATELPATEIPTEVPTELPATDVPATISPTEAPGEQTVFVSERDSYLEASALVLSGGSFDDRAFSLRGSGVFFDIDGDRLVAYEKAVLLSEGSGLSYREYYEFLDPVAEFPAELGLRAKHAVGNYLRENGFSEFTDDESLQLFGFMGDNYLIFTDTAQMGYQAIALFRLDDSGNWVDFPAPDKIPTEVTGGCIVDENVAYVCYFDRALMYYDDYTPRQLTVWRTTDGGATWADIDLWIPAEFDGTPETGIIAPPTAALSPVFDGDHGVLFVSCTKYYTVDGKTDIRTETVWFESFDGGESWNFIQRTVI